MRWIKAFLCGAVLCVVGCTGIASVADGGEGGGSGGSGGGLGGGGGGDVDSGIDAGDADAGPWGLEARPPNTSCIAPPRPMAQSGVTIARAFTALTFSQPILLTQPPGDASRIYILERTGSIRSFPARADAGTGDVTTLIDISAKIDLQGEGGFLGFAFHPDWANRKELYLSYTETGSGPNPLRSVISRVRSTDNGVTFDPASEEVLLKLDQPFNNHDGGNIMFGPDGYLYIGFGDGGSGGDPLGSGQRVNTLLGKFLRIDVNVPAAQRYAIPATNPFADGGVACNLSASAYTVPDAGRGCAEIYAWGMRNPWRYSFDQATGELWAGDVGQNTWEEVDTITLGGNYGWNVREGAHCYSGATCQTAGLIDPLIDYDRSQGNCVTGGYVYRGSLIPGLVGHYIFGDYGSGRVWSLETDPVTGARSMRLLQATGINIASFGQTLDGEVYALGVADGRIYQVLPQGTPPVDPLAPRLSQTGCFDGGQPLPALIPYDINAPLWSDGAGKQRYFAIPDGTSITIGPDGDWDFPSGSVLVKTFLLGGKKVETRLLMRHPDGVWAGYSYEWADDESDATLLPAGKTKTVGAQSWTYPSRPQCMQCHTAAAGRSLGLETAQLNRWMDYPRGVNRNELVTLDGLGFFLAPLDAGVAALDRLEPPSGTGPLDLRARAYLHSNCSICHRAGGAMQGPQDFRAALTLKQMNVCGVAPQNGDLGVTNPLLLAPADPGRSIISVRTHALNAYRMPPLGTVVVDQAGTSLLDQWIGSIAACPP